MEQIAVSALETVPCGQAGKPLVSVVVINYNYGRYLGECIESVLAQDYEPMEVIVVDDGSTDNSRDVINSYDGRVLASFKQNGGVISATNRGFQLSHGPVVIFVDADDYLLPEAVANHATALQDPAVVRSQTYLTVLHDTKPTGTKIPGVPAGDGDLRDLVLQKGPGAYVCPPTSGNAWSRTFLERIFPLPETLRGIAQDALMMDTAPLFGKTVTLDHCGAAYRLHDTNATGDVAEMNLDSIRKVLTRHEKRSKRLAEIATSLGHSAPIADWKISNWRLMTLEYLSSRLSDTSQPPRLADHLASAFKIRGSLMKKLGVASAILSIRLAPKRISLRITRRIIELRSM